MKQPKRGSRERPPQTLDLTATEIASETVKPEPAETAAESPPSDQPEAVVAQPAEPVAPMPVEEPKPAVDAPKPGATQGEPSKPDWLNVASKAESATGVSADRQRRLNWENIAASALGAGVMLGLFLAIYASGAFTPRDDQSAALTGQLTGLEKQVRDLTSRPSAPLPITPPVNTQMLADLEARVAKAEAAANAPRPVQSDPALAGIKSHLDAATAAASDAKSRADAAFEASQKNAQAVAAPPSNEKEVTELTTRVATLEKAAKTAEADRPIRLAFVTGALRATVERGDPFVQELAALLPLVTDAKLLAPLEPFAAGGVPRNVQLSRDLSGTTGSMLTAAGGSARDGGFMDRLQQNAERLVRIRPINEAPGDEPATIVSRADVKATNGNIPGAVAELMTLPPAVRAIADGWIKKAEAQQAALTAARNLAEGAIAALAKP